jgi:hypothetical protein
VVRGNAALDNRLEDVVGADSIAHIRFDLHYLARKEVPIHIEVLAIHMMVPGRIDLPAEVEEESLELLVGRMKASQSRDHFVHIPLELPVEVEGESLESLVGRMKVSQNRARFVHILLEHLVEVEGESLERLAEAEEESWEQKLVGRRKVY